MEKIQLHWHEIYAELHSKYSRSLATSTVGVVLVIALVLAMVINFEFILPKYLPVIIILSLSLLALVAYSLVRDTCIMAAIKRKKLQIKLEQLQPSRKRGRFFTFENYGSYYLSHYETFNTYKKDYTIDCVEMYKSSKVGDYFYVVSHNKHILSFYPANFFEYKEPSFSERLGG